MATGIGERFQEETKYVRGKLGGGYHVRRARPEPFKTYPEAARVSPPTTCHSASRWNSHAETMLSELTIARPSATAETRKISGSSGEYHSGWTRFGAITMRVPSDDWCSVESSTPTITISTRKAEALTIEIKPTSKLLIPVTESFPWPNPPEDGG